MSTNSKEEEVNKIITEVCHYLQSQDRNGSYLEILDELKSGELTKERAVDELKTILSRLIMEYGNSMDKKMYSKLTEIKV